MARSELKRLTKRERAQERRRAARRRRVVRRLRWGGLAAAAVLLPVAALIEFTGPDELVKAEVIRTQRWSHVTAGGSHTHVRATLEIEGRSTATIERADGYERGQWVPVWIRRGRVTGWPRFQDVASPEEPEAAAPAPEPDEDGVELEVDDLPPLVDEEPLLDLEP